MAVRFSLIPLAASTLASLVPAPGWADPIDSLCGHAATGFIQVGKSRSCLGPKAWGAAGLPADRPAVAFLGTSHADAVLQADTARSLLLLLDARGCSTIRTITRRVIDDRPQNVSGGRRWWKEGWSAAGCGRTFAYTVLFQGDGRGGTVFRLSPLS